MSSSSENFCVGARIIDTSRENGLCSGPLGTILVPVCAIPKRKQRQQPSDTLNTDALITPILRRREDNGKEIDL